MDFWSVFLGLLVLLTRRDFSKKDDEKHSELIGK